MRWPGGEVPSTIGYIVEWMKKYGPLIERAFSSGKLRQSPGGGGVVGPPQTHTHDGATQGGDLWTKGADLPSAATLAVGVAGHYFHVTGVTTITAIASRPAGTELILEFDGALTITHGAALILANATNIVTAASDVIRFTSEGGGTWRQSSSVQTASSPSPPGLGPVAGQIDIGDAASDGVSASASHADHQHPFPAPGAGYPVDVGASEADGTATTPARSDHAHAHGVIASGDLHSEYVREASAEWVDLTDAGPTTLHTHAGGSGHTIKENGTPLTQRTGLNFGDGIVATDDAAGDETDVGIDYAGTAQIADVAAAEAAGTSPTVPRGDHVHAHPALASGDLHPEYQTPAEHTAVGDSAPHHAQAHGSAQHSAQSDAEAVHDNVAGEIAAVTEKVAPVSADLLLLEDSAAANAKKRVQIGNLGLPHTAAQHHEGGSLELALQSLNGYLHSIDALPTESVGVDGVRVGTFSGTPRAILERGGTIWEIDIHPANDELRIFKPGALKLTLFANGDLQPANNIIMAAGKTVDGVDVSAHAAAADGHPDHTDAVHTGKVGEVPWGPLRMVLKKALPAATNNATLDDDWVYKSPWTNEVVRINNWYIRFESNLAANATFELRKNGTAITGSSITVNSGSRDAAIDAFTETTLADGDSLEVWQTAGNAEDIGGSAYIYGDQDVVAAVTY